MRCKNPDGSFRMAERGEIDMRGSYIAIILSSLLNIKTPELLGKKIIIKHNISLLLLFL